MEISNMLERFYLNNSRNIFNKLFEMTNSCDVTLIGDDGTCVKCHRFVLSGCSPFFDRTFMNLNKGNISADADNRHLIILLATYKSINVQRMVDYLYYGKLTDDLYDKDIGDDFIRLANELKVVGLYELLLFKQQERADNERETTEIIDCNNIVHRTEPNTAESHVVKSTDLLIAPGEGNRRDKVLKSFDCNNSDVRPIENNISGNVVASELEQINELKETLKSIDCKNIDIQPTNNGLPDNGIGKTSKLDIVSEESNRPKLGLKTSAKYETWMRRLSNIRKRQTAKNKILQDKNPLELLNEIIEGIKYQLVNLPNGEWKCLAKIEGHCFSGQGSSQPAARLENAKVILKTIFNIAFDQPSVVTAITESSVNTNDKFGDFIEWLVLDKYKNVMSNNPSYLGYKVIADIIKSVDNDRNNLKVISIGTGSKFLYEKHLSSVGNAVHDTHAEGVARRGFIRYIYNQISQYVARNPSNSIFEKANAHKKFRLKSGVKFHLYVSTAPCGDARVHSHTNGKEIVNTIIPEGQLRTKGQCALTVTKDGMSSENIPNVNMSCSAKLLRWNVLGVQGAVLSELIEPIYLTSMIFGEKFDLKHMKIALYGRIECVESSTTKLPTGFNIVQPELMKVSATKAKPAAYSPNYSVNWNAQVHDV